jgi:hypothetical protein
LTISEEAARRIRGSLYRFLLGADPRRQGFQVEFPPQFCTLSETELEEIITRAVARGVEKALKSVAEK